MNVITEQYQPLLDAQTIALGHIKRLDTTVRQPVPVTTVTGEMRSYVWYLERQNDPPHDGCWRTTGVRASLDGVGG